ncbi:uncharacterized protein NEMAJ01_2220 [Nematocida major]|uniref:uncharacterized protein n=1 Tax=Nematocida major TaxID=1912982 RepID=UPI0020074D5D|nr:uncharacterized protein NEMAJ01_2220 [Nematocida major]KAH9387324.1 hypothetical protein NEMAJ01_2220 [Nematocida major]
MMHGQEKDEQKVSPHGKNSSDMRHFEIKYKIEKDKAFTEREATPFFRADGRSSAEERSIEVLVGNEGTLLRAYSCIGDRVIYSSAIMVCASADIKRPPVEKPKQGKLSLYCSDRGLHTEIEKIFRRSKIVPPEKLSVIPKVAVLNVKVDVFVVHDKGGLLALATEGVFRALMNVKVAHQLAHRGDTVKASHKISELVTFYPTTKACAKVRGVLVHDPTESEVAESTARFSITYTKQESGEKMSRNRSGDVLHCVYTGDMQYAELRQALLKALDVE